MSGQGGPGAGMRIGDVAAQAGVSSRTLRYYEERGIFKPSVHTSGGERRYGPEDVAQLRRILELRNGLGLSVEEVRVFIESERRLGVLRSAYHETERPAERMELVTEAVAIRRELVARIDAKMAQLGPLRQELLTTIVRQEQRLEELRQESVSEPA
jgi:MerR family transcriptional regulator, repressor of the yfmOP operon